ncbi:hypothetical protein [Allochromatium vinosum]|uniref:hypothetical protein n=1 Tax=Allochromatium vinosum TaxID=1049 RepID=UPI001905DC3B|nr:hypothetical protein [Allochromatium vinosum]MBK1654994.1 hypothetical protein [Allochromatium vinosum]
MIQRTQEYLNAAYARVQAYARGWRCRDKILVIESDDWGSIRTSSAAAYAALVARGYRLDRSCWSVDALETDEDLLALYEVLDRFRDRRGRPACITANMVMANPDFAAIGASAFGEYAYESVAATLERSPERRGVTRLWREGMQSRCFRPQFHAREHVRWRPWLMALHEGSREALETFDHQMCGVPLKASQEGRSFFEPVYTDPALGADAGPEIAKMVREGIALFEAQFGFRPLSTVAPNCAWTDEAERAWAEGGVRYLQGGFLQYGGNGDRVRAHYLGERTRHNGRYLVRNCTFEPAKDARGDGWKRSLAEIARAFRFGTPAIVTSHRVNYVGSVDTANRERGLSQLGLLLEGVTAHWPDVHFLSSPELGAMIEHDLRRVAELEGLEDRLFPAATPAAVPSVEKWDSTG